MVRAAPEPLPEPPPLPEGPLFEDIAADVPEEPENLFDDMPEDAIVPAVSAQVIKVEDEIDLARAELARMLNETFTLEQRAALLVKLAHHTDTKRAPVALRAIQEVNLITGISKERPVETMPMFQLPSDTAVKIKIEKVVK